MQKDLVSLLLFILIASSLASKEKLQLNLIKRHTYYQVISSDNTISQIINGQEINSYVFLSTKVSYYVKDVKDSVYDLKVRYKNLSMKMGSLDHVLDINSEKDDVGDVFSTIFKQMKSKSFSMKMTKRGRVIEVKGVDSLFSNVLDMFPQLTDAQRNQILGQFTQAYGERAFKGNFEMSSSFFPNTFVSKWSKWNINTQLDSNISAILETTYELKGSNNSYCHISGNSTMKMADKNANLEINGMKLKYDIRGNATSDIKIYRKSGWITDASLSLSMGGVAYLEKSPRLPHGMIIPIMFKTEMTVRDY